MFTAYLCDSSSTALSCITISPFNFSCGSSGNIFDLKDLKMGKEGQGYYLFDIILNLKKPLSLVFGDFFGEPST